MLETLNLTCFVLLVSSVPIDVNLDNPYGNREFVIAKVHNFEVAGGELKDAFEIIHKVDRRWVSQGGGRAWWQAKLHPTFPNIVVVKAVAIDYNLYHNFLRCIFKYERDSDTMATDTTPERNEIRQLSHTLEWGLNHANRLVADDLEGKLFAHYALVFPPGTVLSLDGMPMDEEDRRERILPFTPIDCTSDCETAAEYFWKNDDYICWTIAIGAKKGYKFARPVATYDSRFASGFGY